MRKIISTVLILVMLLGIVPTICAEESVTIRLTRAVFNLPESDPEQVQKVEDAINAYIADKINVRIELVELGSDKYGEKVKPILERGETNLLWTASWEDVIGTNELVAQDLVYDITDLLTGSKLRSSIPEELWETTSYEDRNYFIPIYKDNVEGYDLMFRKDMVDAHGWEILFINELSDIEPMLADAKADGLKYPFLTQRTAMFYRWYIDRFDFFTGDVTTNFFAIDRETDEVVNTILTPEYAEFAKLMGRWGEKGYISPDDFNRLTNDTTTQTQEWAVSWWTDIPVNVEASSRYGQEVMMHMMTNRYAHSNSALGSCYCVTADSTPEQAKAAIDFLGLLYTDRKLADLYTYGIAGEDYEYTRTEDQKIQHVTPHSERYTHSMWESAPATIATPLYNEPDNKIDLYLDFNANALTSAAAGFRFDKRPVEAAYGACQSLFYQYGFLLENGGIPEAQVDSCIAEYQAALDDAGYQTVLDEFKRQYDEWKRQ